MKKLIIAFASIALFATACADMEEPLEENPDIVEPIDKEPVDELPPEELPPEELPEDELQLAEQDGDSVTDPAVSQFMSPTGTRVLEYSGAISYPQGDQADYVEFEVPNNSNSSQRIYVTLDANLEGQQDAIIHATLFEDGEQVSRRVLANDGEVNLTIDNTKIQTLRIAFTSAGEPTYAEYTLTVRAYR